MKIILVFALMLAAALKAQTPVNPPVCFNGNCLTESGGLPKPKPCERVGFHRDKPDEPCTMQTNDGCNTTTWTENELGVGGVSTAMACSSLYDAMFPKFKPDPLVTTEQSMTLQSNTLFISSRSTKFMSSIATCPLGEDLTKLKDCKLEEGHTLDDVVNYFMESQRQQQRDADNKYQELLKMFEQYIASVKSDLATIGADLKAANPKNPSRHHSTAPKPHKSHRRTINPAPNPKGR